MEMNAEDKDSGTARRLLKIDEVAKLFGLSIGTVYHLVSQGRLPCIRLSKRCLRFRESDLASLVEERAVPVTSPLENRTTRTGSGK